LRGFAGGRDVDQERTACTRAMRLSLKGDQREVSEHHWSVYAEAGKSHGRSGSAAGRGVHLAVGRRLDDGAGVEYRCSGTSASVLAKAPLYTCPGASLHPFRICFHR
jgi:hypothetical protein